MACAAAAAAAGRQGGGALLAAMSFRVALLHGSAPCNEKWESKWKSKVYGYMDADACGKRHRTYVKRQKRAADKRSLLKWRSLEMHADDYREVQERGRQHQVELNANKPHSTAAASGWSRRFENEWRIFQKKFRGRQGGTYQTNTQNNKSPESGASEEPDSNGFRESESARYRRQFWNNSWRVFEGFADHAGAHWNFRASSGGAARPHRGRSSCDGSIGSPADRSALGLSPAGPLSLEELKSAFRQCALTWHPDRHHGDQKQFAEAEFKRVGDAYRTLRELL